MSNMKDDDAPMCEQCGEWFTLRDGCDNDGLCDICAHSQLAAVLEDLAKMKVELSALRADRERLDAVLRGDAEMRVSFGHVEHDGPYAIWKEDGDIETREQIDKAMSAAASRSRDHAQRELSH